MAVRWIRLDTTWSQSEWIADLPPASRLAWIELLCFVKSHGVAGSVKKPSNALFAQIWGLSKSSVEAMLAAASHDGAVVFDGADIVITGWGVLQMDTKAAVRMKAYRERLKGESLDQGPPSVTPVTRNKRNALRVTPASRPRARPTLTKTVTSHPPSPTPARTHARGDREDDEDIEQEIRKHQPQAKLNIVAIHGGTSKPVTIEGHKVGLGVEIDTFKRLCRDRRDPPEIIAAAIAHIPVVAELQPPVSLARWGADDGMPIYEQCIGLAYKEASR